MWNCDPVEKSLDHTIVNTVVEYAEGLQKKLNVVQVVQTKEIYVPFYKPDNYSNWTIFD